MTWWRVAFDVACGWWWLRTVAAVVGRPASRWRSRWVGKALSLAGAVLLVTVAISYVIWIYCPGIAARYGSFGRLRDVFSRSNGQALAHLRRNPGSDAAVVPAWTRKSQIRALDCGASVLPLMAGWPSAKSMTMSVTTPPTYTPRSTWRPGRSSTT